MTLIVLGLCHETGDEGSQTKAGYTDRALAYFINKACQSKLLDEGYMTLHLDHGKLHNRIDAINALLRTMPVTLAVEVHMNNFKHKEREGFFLMAWHSGFSAIDVAKKIAGELRLLKRKDLGINLVDHRRRWIDDPKAYGSAPAVAWLEDIKLPSLIVEVCHLSNDKEAEWIEKIENPVLVGEALADAIIEYLREA